MAEQLASSIIFTEEKPTIPTTEPAPSAIPLMQGVAERGPISEATRVDSFEEYSRIFGGDVAGYQLTQNVRSHYMQSRTGEMWISRVCHFTDYRNKLTATAVKGSVTLQTDTSSPSPGSVVGSISGPWALESGDTLIGSVNGLADQTATFTATAASLECTNAETYDLDNNMTLTLKVDGGLTQTVTFLTAEFVNIDAATAEEVVAVINAKAVGVQAKVTTSGTKVTIVSDLKGTDSEIEVTGGTANAVLGFSLTPVAGTGSVADISAVTPAEVKSHVEAAWTNGGGVSVTSDLSNLLTISTVGTGSGASIQVKATSSAEGKFGLDTIVHSGAEGGVVDTLKFEGKTPGAYVNGLKVKIEAASSGSSEEFNLQFTKNNAILETFPNVTMDTVEAAVNSEIAGSNLFVAEDLGAAGTLEQRRPANTSGATPTGGDDGLTSLDVWDFIGDRAAGTGQYAFNTVPGVSVPGGTLLACPDRTDVQMHKAMLELGRVDWEGRLFCVLDTPAGYTPTQALAHKASLDGELAAKLGIFHWPRISMMNPNKAVYGSADTIITTVSGCMTGMCRRIDNEVQEGPFAQPAGVDYGHLVGVVGVENPAVLLKEVRNKLFPKRINPVAFINGYGYFLDGSRCLVADENFPHAGARRGVITIENTIDYELQWVRHKNNTKRLRDRVNEQCFVILDGWMKRGAFASMDHATAFYIDTSDALNPPSLQRQGKLKVRIGLATVEPAEFVEFLITKDTRALEAELGL